MRTRVLWVCLGALAAGCGGTSPSIDARDAGTDEVQLSPEAGADTAVVPQADADEIDAPGSTSCAPPATFMICLRGSCNTDVNAPAICRDGAWSCPSGTVDSRSCGCYGNIPPWCSCSGGFISCSDGGAPRD